MLHMHHFFFCMKKNIEDYDKQDIVTNKKFEAIISSIKKNLFHQRMVDFVNKLELSDKNTKLIGV